MSLELQNVTATVFDFVGCNNATDQICVGISGAVSYLPDFKSLFNSTCGQFLPTNKTLVETVGVAMGGIAFAVGVAPNTVGNVSNYVQAAAIVMNCGHEALKAVSPTYDTASALIGAGAGAGGILMASFGLWSIAKCRKMARERTGEAASLPKQGDYIRV